MNASVFRLDCLLEGKTFRYCNEFHRNVQISLTLIFNLSS